MTRDSRLGFMSYTRDPGLRRLHHGPILPMADECARLGIAPRLELFGGLAVLVAIAVVATFVVVVLP